MFCRKQEQNERRGIWTCGSWKLSTYSFSGWRIDVASTKKLYTLEAFRRVYLYSGINYSCHKFYLHLYLLLSFFYRHVYFVFLHVKRKKMVTSFAIFWFWKAKIIKKKLNSRNIFLLDSPFSPQPIDI